MPVIQESLLSAEYLGQEQMKVFVEKRLCEPANSHQNLELKSPTQKNNAKTFASLYEVVKPSKGRQDTIKVDRNILQRLITAYRVGREVNLENILQHELMTVPLSLATTNGSLHSTNKSVLANILTQEVQTPANVTLDEPSFMVLEENKADLAILLSNHLIEHSPKDKQVVVAGGLPKRLQSSHLIQILKSPL